MQTKPGSTLGVFISFSGCQICKVEDHLAINCPKYATSRPKCLKCGELHRIENCGPSCLKCGELHRIEKCGPRCNFCRGLKHIEERC
jgi:hypothetical protein